MVSRRDKGLQINTSERSTPRCFVPPFPINIRGSLRSVPADNSGDDEGRRAVFERDTTYYATGQIIIAVWLRTKRSLLALLSPFDSQYKKKALSWLMSLNNII